jgi:hypothetical protein
MHWGRYESSLTGRAKRALLFSWLAMSGMMRLLRIMVRRSGMVVVRSVADRSQGSSRRRVALESPQAAGHQLKLQLDAINLARFVSHVL